MNTFLKKKKAQTDNCPMFRGDPAKKDYTLIGNFVLKEEAGHYRYVRDISENPKHRAYNTKLSLQAVMDDGDSYLWGYDYSQAWIPHYSYIVVDGRYTNLKGDYYKSIRIDATAERVHSYINRKTLSGLEYDTSYRRFWNPKLDDSMVQITEFDINEDLQKWLTKAYIKTAPELKKYFQSTIPHTPPMAALAIKHPGFRVLIAGGWIPTIPYTTSQGVYKTLMDQPSPERLLRYMYGSSSKDNFKHLRREMPKHNNWALAIFGRWGREFFPKEWVKELEVTEEEHYPEINTGLNRITIATLKRQFGQVKRKRVLELFQDTVRSVANMELFFDIWNMNRTLSRNPNRVNVWTEFNTRHIDEMHMRTTEVYNERFRNRYARNYVDHSAKWNDETPLKPAKNLLEIQDAAIDKDITIRVAETAGEVAAWGQAMEHCIASYIPQAMKGNTSLIAVYKGSALYANVSVAGGRITQIRGYRNAAIPPSIQEVVKTAVGNAFASPDNSDKSSRILVPG